MDLKSVSDSRTEQIHIVRYKYLNSQRRLFGGVLMQWIDELAGIVSSRHWGGSVITAAVDSLIFKQPAYLNDLIMMTGQITHIGSTSMEVRVDTYASSRGGEKRLINTAYLVMVAIDENDKPAAVPGITLETDEQRHEWEMGEKRYQLRKARRKENY